MFKKIVLKIFISITLLALLLYGLFLTLSTERGTRIITSIIAKITPGTLSFQTIEGALTKSLNIKNLSYQHKNLETTMKELQITWEIKSLLKGKMHITKLNAENIEIKTAPILKADKKKSKIKKTFSIKTTILPSALQIDNAQIKNFIWQAGDKKPFIINSISLKTTIEDGLKNIEADLFADVIKGKMVGQLNSFYEIKWQIDFPNLKRLNPNLFGHLKAAGVISGTRKNPTIEASFSGKLNDLTLRSSILKAVIEKQALNIETKSDIGTKNPIVISLMLPKYTKLTFPKPKQKIIGTINWRTKELAFLHSLFPELKNPRGMIDLQTKISGTLQNPHLTGIFNLTGFDTEITRLKLHLTKGQLQAISDNNQINYHGQINSGKGTIKISGKTKLKDKKSVTELSISGKKVFLSNTRTLNLIATPNLTLRLKGKKIETKGTVFVPKARIKPESYKDVITLPKEVKIIREKDKDKALRTPLQIESHASITLILGDDVKIDIMGLSGNLTGTLKINDTPINTFASGTLNIKNGIYNIYGQVLNIDHGTLYFANSPIANPMINIELIRTFRSVEAYWLNQNFVVGMHIKGSLNSPKINLFSSLKTLSDADILSYLIIGQSSNQASPDKMQLVLRAAEVLNFRGMREFTNLTDQIRKKLGLTHFGLETQPEVQSNSMMLASPVGLSQKSTMPTTKTNSLASTTAFVLGKYLSPKLYLSYSYKLMDQVNVLKLNYLLSKSWHIQSEASTLGHGIDLIYRIERN